MAWTDFFTKSDSGDTGGAPYVTNASHNLTKTLHLPDPWEQLYGDPAKKQKAALQQAADQMHALAASERAQQMQGLQGALAAYQPAQGVYNNLYGGTLTTARPSSLYGGK